MLLYLGRLSCNFAFAHYKFMQPEIYPTQTTKSMQSQLKSLSNDSNTENLILISYMYLKCTFVTNIVRIIKTKHSFVSHGKINRHRCFVTFSFLPDILNTPSRNGSCHRYCCM